MKISIIIISVFVLNVLTGCDFDQEYWSNGYDEWQISEPIFNSPVIHPK